MLSAAADALPSAKAQAAARQSYIALDLIRFAAALFVALFHLAYLWWLPSFGPTPIRPIIVEPFRWGWVGVEIFFVLSGFVISFSADGKTVGRFATSRVLRLYPSAWICATVTLLVARLGTADATADYVRAIALSPVGTWISGTYWTLAIEIMFYLAVALFLWRGWKLMTLATWLGLVSGAYWFFRAADFAAGGHFKDVFTLVESPIGNLTLIPHGCFFAIGMALREWTVRPRSTGPLRLAAIAIPAGLISVAAAARFHLADSPGATFHMIEPILFWLAAVALIGASVHWNEAIQRRWGRFGPAVRTIGLMTYPLYLVHSEVGHVAMLHLLWLGSGVALVVTMAAMMIVSFAVVWAERYPRQFIKQLMAPPQARADLLAVDLP